MQKIYQATEIYGKLSKHYSVTKGWTPTKLILKKNNRLKIETLAPIFFCEFCENSRSTFSTKHLRVTASDFKQAFSFHFKLLLSNSGFYMITASVMKKLSNYVDDNTLYTFRDYLKKIKDEAVLKQCISGFTKIVLCWMRENVILCVSGITQKTKHSYSRTSLWKIAKNKKFLEL